MEPCRRRATRPGWRSGRRRGPRARLRRTLGWWFRPRSVGTCPQRSTRLSLDDDTVPEVVRALLHGTGHGSDFPRLLAFLRAARPSADTPWIVDNLAEARRVLSRGAEWWVASNTPQYIAALLLSLSGEPQLMPLFCGYPRHITSGEADRNPSSLFPPSDPYIPDDDLPEYQSLKYGYTVFIRSHSPSALLCTVLTRARYPEFLTEPPELTVPFPPLDLEWSRSPGRLPVDERDRRNRAHIPGWTLDQASLPADLSTFQRAALDLTDVVSEARVRRESAAHQKVLRPIIEWSWWLYRNVPDVFSVHAHPLLTATPGSSDFDGVEDVFSALAKIRRRPGTPTYSALALGCSVDNRRHRSAAARAVGSIAESNLLDPREFAEEVVRLIGEDFVTLARVVDALSEASTVSALAGYRAMQVLEVILEHAADLTRPVDVVRALAPLGRRFGVAPAVPDSLRARARPRSALGDALRELDVNPAAETEEVRRAAEQACMVGA